MWFERPGSTPAVRTVWRATVEEAGEYLVAGSEFWGISFIRRADGSLGGELDGPSMSARSTTSVAGESYWGVELAPFVVVTGLDKQPVLGATVDLPVRSGQVRLGERWTTLPAFDELEDWVDEMVRLGPLGVDEGVRAALDGHRDGASPRTWQRRYRRSVGLTAGQVEQVRRAERAYALLLAGVAPAEAAARAGFADQAHLTRSLRLIRGRTPAAVLAAAARRRPPVG
ncbi:helix-turn-helix domain-containing protein [Isoptericola sp. NPDC057653]|uniref:helix-turn-helix domain-containing protein n=1 Tax=Isoptericola sp. NPDC057653 TaxID=3346195 RepID=UPI0036B1C134